MPRVISFLVLLAIVLLVGVVFFQVMAQFLIPLFLAAVVVVVFQPLHKWVCGHIPRHKRLAALVTTLLIMLVVLLPMVWLGWNAYVECYGVYDRLQADESAETAQLQEAAGGDSAQPAASVPRHAGPSDDAAESAEAAEPSGEPSDIAAQIDRRAGAVKDFYKQLTNKDLDIATLVDRATAWGANFVGAAVLTGVQTMLGLIVGLAIMMISVYYYLADGPAMTRALMRLSPLDDRYELELLERFSEISRSVVVATLLSAVVQGAAAGVGYWFALPGAAPIFLLTALTMVGALVPFVGGALVWVPVCGYLLLFAPHADVDGQVVHGNWVAAAMLAAYCAVVVSSADNMIKPFVLRGQANLHPLLALLSILGGAQVLGPIGILVGPMIVSFLQALLNMLNKELASFDNKDGDQPSSLAAATAQVADAVKSAALDQPPQDATDTPATPALEGKSDDDAAKPSHRKPEGKKED